MLPVPLWNRSPGCGGWPPAISPVLQVRQLAFLLSGVTITRDWLRLAAICELKTARRGAFLRQNDSNPVKLASFLVRKGGDLSP